MTEDTSSSGYFDVYSLANSKFVPDSTIIYGHRATGKTTLIMHEIYNAIADEIDNLYVFTDVPKPYNKITTKTYNSKEIRLIETIMNDNIKNQKKILVILESCGTRLSNNKYIDELLMNGRFYNIKVVTSMQYYKSLSPSNRGAADNIFSGDRFGENDVFSNKDILMFDKCMEGQFGLLYKSRSRYNSSGIYIIKPSIKEKLKLFNCDNNVELSDENKNANINELVEECNNAINNLVRLRNKIKLLIQ